MQKDYFPKLLNSIIILGITITLLLLLGTPFIVTAFFKIMFVPIDINLIISITACIYICAFPYVIALFKLKRLSKLILNNNPFSLESVKSLKFIAVCAFSEIITFTSSIMYLKYNFEFFKYFVFGGPIIVVIFISIFIGILCLVLSQLFETAIRIKEENEYTI